jgi:hypothetical protein
VTWHDPIEPTRVDTGDGPLRGIEETHPAWGLIGANRVSHSPPGATLFDSDIQHQYSVVVRIATASRRRDLSHDWLHREDEFVEVEMSEAQWASFVSSMNSGQGVPCTIRRREDEVNVPGVYYAPRLQESIAEVRGAAERAVEKITKAFAEVEEAFDSNAGKKVLREKIRDLSFAIGHMPANATFAAESLNEHAENVVQKARADIEAMVLTKAHQLGLEPGDLGMGMPQLAPPSSE